MWNIALLHWVGLGWGGVSDSNGGIDSWGEGFEFCMLERNMLQ